MEEFALSLHPEKTRLIEFGRYAAARRERRGLGKPETFNFLGFTFICGKSRRGNFLLKRKTRRDRMRAKLQEIKEELRRRMHQPIPEQGRWLKQVVSGFFAYHAVPTNSRGARGVPPPRRPTSGGARCGDAARRTGLTWERMTKLADDWLPKPRILHPWPQHALRRQTPEVGAVCGNAARTDLCGGRSVMGVPTAIDKRAVHFLGAIHLAATVIVPFRGHKPSPSGEGKGR